MSLFCLMLFFMLWFSLGVRLTFKKTILDERKDIETKRDIVNDC